MEPTQIVIIFVSVTLTTIIAVLSIQVWNILKEFRNILREVRESVIKTNKMLDDAGKMTGTASETVEQIGGALAGIKSVFGLISSFRKKGEE